MKRLNKLTVAILGSVALSSQVLASEAEYMHDNFLQDAALIFAGDAQNLQLAPLSRQEMLETEGEYFNLLTAGFGAVGGGVYYTTYTFASGGSWDFYSFSASVVGGGISGFFVNPSLAVTVGAGFGGAAAGVVEYYR